LYEMNNNLHVCTICLIVNTVGPKQTANALLKINNKGKMA